MLLFIRSLYHTRPRTPSGHCSLYSFRIGARLVPCLFCICLLFVFHLFLHLLHTCSRLVSHLSFSLVHSLATCRSPFLFCILYTLYFIHFSFALHSSLVRCTLVRNLSPTCSPFVSLGFRLFPICFPLALHSFCFHLFVICLFPIRSTFILHLFPVLPLSIIVCFLFCEAECGAPTPVKAHHRVSRACVRVYVCVSRDRFSARNFPEARIDVKAKRRVSRKDSRVRLGSEVRRA